MTKISKLIHPPKYVNMREEQQHREVQSRVIQSVKQKKLGGIPIVDNRDTPQIRLMKAIQRMGMEEEELQMKPIAQLQSEDEELQMKPVAQLQSEDEELQMKPIVQLQSEDDELLQGKFETIQQKPNHTGLPDNLKSGVENMSGFSMDDVRVHYNSDKPAQMQAHAYAQGTDIHVASGQEKHLPHEAWHVVQQMQGRVQPTVQMQGVGVNNDTSLESEADVMGLKALQIKTINFDSTLEREADNPLSEKRNTLQKCQQPVMQCSLITRELFINSTKPKIGRRGVSNGIFYTKIDPLLHEYVQITSNRTDKLQILLELKRILEDWNASLSSRTNSKRHNAYDELYHSVDAEWSNLFLPKGVDDNDFEKDRKIKIEQLFNNDAIVLKYRALTRARSLSGMLRLIENIVQKKIFIASIDQIRNISTDDGIKKIIVSAHENVGECRPMFPYDNLNTLDEIIRIRVENALATFLNRLKLMTEFIVEIANTVIPESDPETTYGAKYYIDSSGSDPHVNGKHALFLINRLDGTRRVYKPRSVEPDNLAVGQDDNGLFKNINSYLHTNSLSVQLPEGIDVHDIGFATMNITPADKTEAFADKTDTMQQSDAKKYFFNAGMLEVIAQIWGLLDLHQDNLMPTKIENIFAPLIIDAECSFVRHQYTGVFEAMKTGGYNSQFLIGDQSSATLFTSQNSEYGRKFDEGFGFMKDIIKENKESFIKFINLDTLDRVRIIPYKTDILGVVLQLYTKRQINVNPLDVNNTSREEFLLDQFNKGFSSRLNDGYSNPPDDVRVPLIADALNSAQFFYNTLGAFVLVVDKYQQKIKEAFDAGTIPAFELKFILTGTQTICQVLCDSTGDDDIGAIIGTIAQDGVNMGDMRNILINTITSKINNVDRLVNPKEPLVQ